MKTASPGVVYVSPMGRRCMLVPLTTSWLYFRYLSDVTMNGDGFTLSRENFRFMREAARQKA